MLTLTHAILHSWTLEPKRYLEFAEEELLDLLIDAGFIFAYETVACQLRLHGRSPTARQDSVAQNIERSALSLVGEVLASNPESTSQGQTRIFGLLATIVNSRIDLPADLAREIPFSREAIDCLTTALFSYRSHHTLAELSKVLDRSDINTPTLRSLLHTVKNLKNPLQHRFEEICGDRPAIACIDERMEEALSISEKVTALIQDGQKEDALARLAHGLAKFPSLMEFHWLRHQLTTEEQAPLTTSLDPGLGCDTQENARSLALWRAPLPEELSRNYLVSCTHRLERPLDHDTRTSLMRLCQILTWRSDAREELEKIRSIRESYQTIGADFDPFFLTLLKTSIKNYWQNRDTKAQSQTIEDIQPSTPKLIVLTGLPLPLLAADTTIRESIRQATSMKAVVGMMQEVDKAILDSAYLQTGVYNYPEVVDALEADQISSARKFYLQNLSFVDPTGRSSIVVHVNQEAFRHLGLLARVFPDMLVVELQPDLGHWIDHCLSYLGGFNCDFAIPSKHELIAYANDYFEIMSIWRKNLSIDIYTMQAGQWLGNPPQQDKIPADLQKVLTRLDHLYNSPMTPNLTCDWAEGAEGSFLKSVAESYQASC
jgi:hypothetical protein